jgi:hypothetical protein
MKRATKILIIACCLMLCIGALLLVPKETAKSHEPKTQVAPVNNRQTQRAIWIQV